MADFSPELKRAKRMALGLLLLVSAIFVGTHFFAPTLWVRCIKAVSEAAMVGALADWFAVSALFRAIPLPWVGRHTAIIARNKDRIGDNLAEFVRDKFLDADSLIELMRRNPPAQWLSGWLTAPGNSHVLGQQLARLALGMLELVQDAQVERWLTRTLRNVVGRMDWSQGIAQVVSALTQGGHHQAVLDDVIERISEGLRQESTRQLIAESLVQWLKREHPLKEKMLPTDWLSGKGAGVIADALDSLLLDIARDPKHRMREAFDAALQRWAQRLKTDPAYARKAQALRDYLLHDEKLAAYLRSLWLRLRARLHKDLGDEHSFVARKLADMGLWLGHSLAQDPALRDSMNERLERWARSLAPEASQFIARHISDTVKRWDAQELSLLIEQHIGKDLQYIRINGTLVGGAIGLLLFVLSHVVLEHP